MAKDFFEALIQNKIAMSCIVILAGIFLYSVIDKILMSGIKNKNLNNRLDRRKKTYLRLFSSIVKYAFIVVVVLTVLQINGVNVSSMLTGLGILSIVVGLAIQDALKDIIMGVNIITDHFFAVGDVIKYKGIEGKVVSFGLKTTKIEDIATGDIISITNRSITEVEKRSDKMYMDILVPYDVSQDVIDKVSVNIVERIKQGEYVIGCRYLGLSDFNDSSISYKLEVKCAPEHKYPVKRLVNRTIKEELDKNNIKIPFTQIDIHNKD